MDLSFSLTLLGYCYTILVFGFLVCTFHYSFRFNHSWKYWWITGSLFNFWSLSFIFSALPLSWSNNIFAQILGCTFFVGITAIAAGSSWIIIGKTLQKWGTKKYFIILLAIACVFSSLLRSLAESIVNLGSASTVGLHIITGTFGQALVYTPLIRLAYGGGIFLLNGLTGVLAWAFYRPSLKLWLYLIAFIGVWYTSVTIIPLHDTPKLSVGVVTTTYKDPAPQELVSNYSSRALMISKLLSQASTTYDVLLLPESTFYLDVSRFIGVTTNPPAHLLIDGSTTFHRHTQTNTSLFYNIDTHTTITSEKQYLMPMSEYTPYFMLPLVWLITSQNDFATYLQEHNAYIPGKIRISTTSHGNSIATLICSEATSYEALLAVHKLHPDIITLQSNLSVFHNNMRYAIETLSYSKLAAATLGRPLISSNNEAPSFAISRRGDTDVILPRINALTALTVDRGNVSLATQ